MERRIREFVPVRRPAMGESDHDLARSLLVGAEVTHVVHEVAREGDTITLRLVRADMEATVEILGCTDGRLDLKVVEARIGNMQIR